MYQLDGKHPWIQVDVVAHGECLEAVESLEATIWDGGEVVPVQENVVKEGEVSE